MRRGYGDPRGIPDGRQFDSGSSFDCRVLTSASAHGSITTESPGFNDREMSASLAPPPSHTPERSGVPSASFGAGPVGVGGCRWYNPTFPPLPPAFPPPAFPFASPAGACACANSVTTATAAPAIAITCL